MTKRTARAQRTQAKNGAGPGPVHLVEPMLAGMTTTRQHLLAWVMPMRTGWPRWTRCEECLARHAQMPLSQVRVHLVLLREVIAVRSVIVTPGEPRGSLTSSPWTWTDERWGARSHLRRGRRCGRYTPVARTRESVRGVG